MYVCSYHWAPGRVAFRLKAAPVKIRIFILLSFYIYSIQYIHSCSMLVLIVMVYNYSKQAEPEGMHHDQIINIKSFRKSNT